MGMWTPIVLVCIASACCSDRQIEADLVDSSVSCSRSAFVLLLGSAPKSYIDFFRNAHGGQAGLANLGNTCFFNAGKICCEFCLDRIRLSCCVCTAGLQALLHTPALIGFFADLNAKTHAHFKCMYVVLAATVLTMVHDDACSVPASIK